MLNTMMLCPISGYLPIEPGEITGYGADFRQVVLIDSEFNTFRAIYKGGELQAILDNDDQPIEAIIEGE